MENDSGNRFIQVQDGENNDSGEKSPIPVSQERHRNEEKDSLANRKQEYQSRVTKRKKKCRKRIVSNSAEEPDSPPPAKKKKKAKRRRHHQSTSSSSSTASDSSTNEESHNDRFKIITKNEAF